MVLSISLKALKNMGVGHKKIDILTASKLNSIRSLIMKTIQEFRFAETDCVVTNDEVKTYCKIKVYSKYYV